MENKSKTNKKNQLKRLAFILSLPAITGGISLAALAGLFRIENFPFLTFSFIIGPTGFITSLLLKGIFKERVLTALLAGLFATLMAILAAGFGTQLLSKLNIPLLRLVGGISVMIISLIIMGLKINDKIPLAIMAVGIVMSLIWK